MKRGRIRYILRNYFRRPKTFHRLRENSYIEFDEEYFDYSRTRDRRIGEEHVPTSYADKRVKSLDSKSWKDIFKIKRQWMKRNKK